MMSTLRAWRFILLGILSFLVMLAACLFIDDVLDNANIEATASKVMKKIHLGMDIDEAIAVLGKDDFMIGSKREEEDCHYNYRKMFKTEVNLSGRFTTLDTFKYVVGIPSHKRPWLYITASLDGEIVRISRDP